MNSSYLDDSVEIFERVNIGIAVASPRQLSVPVILDAYVKTLVKLSA